MNVAEKGRETAHLIDDQPPWAEAISEIVNESVNAGLIAWML